MLWRLVAKLLLKATVPLIAIAGLFTYGVYTRGGDPAALWTNIASRGVSQFTALISGVQNDSRQVVNALSDTVGQPIVGDSASHTSVFTWQDADGVTHYSTSAPEGIEAQALSINPDVNVLAPVPAPSVAPKSASGQIRQGSAQQTRESSAQVAQELGGTLPGVAGQVLSNSSDVRAESSGSAMDPQQLLKMLQSAGN